MINGRNFLDQTVKYVLRTYDNIRKIATDQGNDYTTGCLIDCPYFKEYYKPIAIDARKQQKLYGKPKAIQQINFIGNLNRPEGATIFFITEKWKEIVLDFLKGTFKVLWF